MRNTHIADHLNVVKLAAIASNDTLLIYLIDMALTHHAQQLKQQKSSNAAKMVA